MWIQCVYSIYSEPWPYVLPHFPFPPPGYSLRSPPPMSSVSSYCCSPHGVGYWVGYVLPAAAVTGLVALILCRSCAGNLLRTAMVIGKHSFLFDMHVCVHTARGKHFCFWNRVCHWNVLAKLGWLTFQQAPGSSCPTVPVCTTIHACLFLFLFLFSLSSGFWGLNSCPVQGQGFTHWAIALGPVLFYCNFHFYFQFSAN